VNVSDYQILNVIKTYIKSMRGKVDLADTAGKVPGMNGDSPLPDEGMRKMVFDRIDEIVSEKVKKHET
jgi:hypothetical protein